jgi:hydroxypyruvate reductase
LAEWQQLTTHLLQSGCTINELNAVRKQLDEVKGGGLALMAQPAATVSLILSDVVGNPLDVIGSGPTAPNPQPPAEALTVLHRYRARRTLARETWSRIYDLLTDPRSATSLARFEGLEVRNIIVGDVRRAANAASAAAEKLGFTSTVLTAHLQGEAREVGRVAAALAKDANAGSCLLLGGETTVTVHGDGHGGRNQELALAAAIALEGFPQRVIASFATDGEDGPTDAAGAVITGETIAAADGVNLDAREYLDRNDSYAFFTHLAKATGRTFLLQPGPTGTNVNDLLFVLRYPTS